MIPGPPPLVTMAILRPAGSGCAANADAVSKSSRTFLIRRTPHWRSIASTAASDSASEPVCDCAARAPAEVRPDFTTSTAFLRATPLAKRIKFLGLPNTST